MLCAGWRISSDSADGKCLYSKSKHNGAQIDGAILGLISDATLDATNCWPALLFPTNDAQSWASVLREGREERCKAMWERTAALSQAGFTGGRRPAAAGRRLDRDAQSRAPDLCVLVWGLFFSNWNTVPIWHTAQTLAYSPMSGDQCIPLDSIKICHHLNF